MADSRLEEDQKNTKKVEEYDVVIIGAGIAGLTAAAKMAQDGRKVLVLEKRSKDSAYIRSQLIGLKKESVDTLKSFASSGDEKFNFDPEQLTHIKDIQRYVANILSDKENCSIAYHSAPTRINMSDGILHFETEKTAKSSAVKFHSLVIADGASRSSSTLLAESGHAIEYKTMFEPQQKYCMSGYLKVEKKDGSDLESPERLYKVVHTTGDQKQLGYISANKYSYDKANKKSMKFFTTTSIPEELYAKFQKKENKEQGVELLKFVASGLYPPETHHVSLVKNSKDPLTVGLLKDNLKFQTFTRSLYQATQGGKEVGGKSILLLGDAYLGADFTQGTGANNAITMGLYAAQYEAGEISMDEFNRLLEEIAKNRIEVAKQRDVEFNKPIPAKTEQKQDNSLLLISTFQTTLKQELERLLKDKKNAKGFNNKLSLDINAVKNQLRIFDEFMKSPEKDPRVLTGKLKVFCQSMTSPLSIFQPSPKIIHLINKIEEVFAKSHAEFKKK